MALAGTPGRGSLVRVDAGPVAATVRTGLTIGHGLGWSPDRRTMYHVDPPQPLVQPFPSDPIRRTPATELQPTAVAFPPRRQPGPHRRCNPRTGNSRVAVR